VQLNSPGFPALLRKKQVAAELREDQEQVQVADVGMVVMMLQGLPVSRTWLRCRLIYVVGILIYIIIYILYICI
jgi:hypothetical protein